MGLFPSPILTQVIRGKDGKLKEVKPTNKKPGNTPPKGGSPPPNPSKGNMEPGPKPTAQQTYPPQDRPLQIYNNITVTGAIGNTGTQNNSSAKPQRGPTEKTLAFERYTAAKAAVAELEAKFQKRSRELRAMGLTEAELNAAMSPLQKGIDDAKVAAKALKKQWELL